MEVVARTRLLPLIPGRCRLQLVPARWAKFRPVRLPSPPPIAGMERQPWATPPNPPFNGNAAKKNGNAAEKNGEPAEKDGNPTEKNGEPAEKNGEPAEKYGKPADGSLCPLRNSGGV
ncbi:hypothetical protein G5714_004199 [Onychostoma macrolepis]|uniref:Uncharacterized protein n=1 Tax=Onychostoma macrolepis TaxID=369639 RepID=A0A7J6DBT5_9TELE|nr:hypothetical protein G5714_004199 [Onychostoma macrolepis]